MKRILFAIFSVIVMLPMASVAATPELNCTMVNGQCPAGCYHSEMGCTACQSGSYNGTPGATKCTTCTIPTEATADPDQMGLTSDNCSWTAFCKSGEYVASTKDLTCQPCGDYYTAKGDDFTITGSGSDATSIDGYKKSDRCDGKVYKLTLKRNSIITDDKTAYFKYDTGFSANSTGPWNKTTLPASALQDNKPVQTFVGYFDNKGDLVWEERDQYFSSNGALTKPQADLAKLANKDNEITLWAGWSFSPYYIYYYYDDAGGSQITQTCGEDKDYSGSTCKTQEYQWDAPPMGKLFTGYNCYTNEEFSNSCTKPFYTPGDQIAPPETDNEKTRYFVAQYDACPAGHYCTNGETLNCPAGTTSDPGAGSATNCYMVRGDGGTKFCDNTGDCFYLPGSGHVPHAKAAGN